MRISTLAFLAATAAALATPAAATTPISGALHSTVQATISAPGDPSTFDSQFNNQTTSWTSAPTTLTLPNSVQANLGDDFARANVGPVLLAHWLSADEGDARLNGYGLTLNSSTTRLFNVGLDSGAPDWSYKFQATGNGDITLHFAMDAFGSPDLTTGLGGWEIGWSGGGGGQQLDAPIGGSLIGTFIRPVTTGQTYTISLTNEAHLLTAGVFDHASAQMDGSFDWIIRTTPPSGAPEPGTWAMLLVGFTGLGVVARRRQVSV